MLARFNLVVGEAFRSISANRSTTIAATLTVLIGMFLLGLFIALGAVAGENVRYFGLIPAGVGAALLIYYFVEGRKLPPGGPTPPSTT